MNRLWFWLVLGGCIVVLVLWLMRPLGLTKQTYPAAQGVHGLAAACVATACVTAVADPHLAGGADAPLTEALAPAAGALTNVVAYEEGAGGNLAGFTPQDRDENYATLPTATLVARLAQATDKIELRKAAQVLGDRAIAGRLALSAEERAAMTNVVRRYLDPALVAASSDEEPKEQLERLWWAAAPALLEHVAAQNLAVAEMAIKALSLMRNEEIVRALMEKVRTTTGEKTKVMYIFALGCMTEQYHSLVPRRTCLNEEASARLAEKLVRPFLQALERTETAPEVRQAGSEALAALQQAADHRPREVPLGQVDEKLLRAFLQNFEQTGGNPQAQEMYRRELERRSRASSLTNTAAQGVR